MTNLPERFWSKVDKAGPGGCWLWTGKLRKNGYGAFRWGRNVFRPHRLAYVDAIGELPAEMPVLDHLCRVRHCVNPLHLEPVTAGENTLRGMAPTVVSRRTGVCFKGHAMTPENTYTKPSSGYRQCRKCISDYNRTRRPGRAA